MAEYISLQSHGCSFYGSRVERMRVGLVCISWCISICLPSIEIPTRQRNVMWPFLTNEMNGFGSERAELIAGNKLLRHRSRGEFVFFFMEMEWDWGISFSGRFNSYALFKRLAASCGSLYQKQNDYVEPTRATAQSPTSTV